MPRNTHSLENNLKQVRTKAGLTQGRLAASARISRQAYSALELGSANPSTEVALRLAKVLRQTVESLFYITERPQVAIEAELV
ncbi:MAG: helix-turn-helix transcriptional regulator, partial [Chloroflexota bacterium]|nr:helix-turn-helix transcriptional regulator [Chloroflexota bacterium]